MVKNYEKRRERLRELTEETKERIASHEEGRNLMEGEEYEKMKKRVELYGKKLERMMEPMDEREIERMVEKERMREERRNHREL